jgi:hypothetical protein
LFSSSPSQRDWLNGSPIWLYEGSPILLFEQPRSSFSLKRPWSGLPLVLFVQPLDLLFDRDSPLKLLNA